MRIRTLLAILPILAAVPIAGAQTASAPSTAAASAPAAAPDYSTPNATVVTFYSALRAGDTKTMHASVLPDKGLDLVVPALFDLSAASARFQAALEKRFTPAEISRAKIGDFVAPASVVKDARDAKVNTEGDTATMTLRTSTSERPFQTITLRRVEGQWKIDAAKTMKLEGQQLEDVKKLLPTVAESKRVIDEIREAVEGGKYASPLAAQRALQEQLTRIAQAARATTTTKP